MKLIIKLATATFAVFIASYVIPNVEVDSVVTALIVAVVLGVLNTFIKPLIVLLTLPITILTLGIFYFVINALLVMLASQLIPGFFVGSFIAALLFSFGVSLVNSFLNLFVD